MLNLIFQFNYPFNPRYGLPAATSDIPVPLVCNDILSCMLLLFRNIFYFLIYISSAFSVIMIIISAIKIITNPSEVSKMGKNIAWIIVGLVVALVSYGLVVLIERFVSSGSL